MKYISLYSLLLYFPTLLIGAQHTETSSLLPTQQIERYIRSNDKKNLALLLIDNPDLTISNDLIQFAYRKEERAKKKCCKNFPAFVTSIASTIFSTSLALQPFSCRPISSSRTVGDVGYWASSVCSTTFSVYYGNEVRKDWSNYFNSTSMIQMLTDYQSKQNKKTTV